MHGGFATLVNPATKVDEVDIGGTRQARELVNEMIRHREDMYPVSEEETYVRNRMLMAAIKG